MTKKIFFWLSVISVFAVIITFITLSDVIYVATGRQIDNELKNEAVMIAAGMDNKGVGYFVYLEDTKLADVRIRLYHDSHLAYDSEHHADPAEQNVKMRDIEELHEATVFGEGYAVRKTSDPFTVQRFYAMRVTNYYYIRLSIFHPSLLGIIRDNFTTIIIILLSIIISAFIMARIASVIIVKPINEMDPNDMKVPDGYTELEKIVNKVNEQIMLLKKNRDEFNSITANMNEGLLTINSSGTVLTVNNSARHILNFHETFDETINISFTELCDESIFSDTIRSSLAGKHSENRIKIGDNTYDLISNPIFDIDDNVIGTVTILINITEKEELERFRREFLSNVSHELKTPISNILGYSEHLFNSQEDASLVRKFSEIIVSESERLANTLRDITRLAKYDENKIKSERYTVDLKKIVRHVAIRLDLMAEEKNVTINIDGCETALINGVYSMLDEIVFNIMENAVKYNVYGGTVNAMTYTEKDYVYLIVEDTGIGIPPNDQQRVFERFFRVDRAHSKTIPGTGLGLSIAKQSIEFHEGNISLKSIPGKGTTFTVRLKSNT
ncbi:MAG: hypothetical protein IKM61_00300 [Eubacteriaceae bacterium]|nr:hypothetical protein [Eubacteriaceae bacterium]